MTPASDRAERLASRFSGAGAGATDEAAASAAASTPPVPRPVSLARPSAPSVSAEGLTSDRVLWHETHSRFTTHLPNDLIADVRATAHNQSVSVSAFVRDALNRRLQELR